MKAGDLDDAFQTEVCDQSFRGVKEIVVVEEVAKNVRMNQQRCLDGCDGRRNKRFEFDRELGEQYFLIVGVADDITNCISVEDTPGERTEVEPDHHRGNPAARFLNDGLWVHDAHCGTSAQQLADQEASLHEAAPRDAGAVGPGPAYNSKHRHPPDECATVVWTGRLYTTGRGDCNENEGCEGLSLFSRFRRRGCPEHFLANNIRDDQSDYGQPDAYSD